MLHHKGLDKMLPLTEKEAMILKFLYRAFPEDVSKQKILGEVWGYQNGVSTHTFETHIYRLRQKIARLSDRQLVVTTDRGYRQRLTHWCAGLRSEDLANRGGNGMSTHIPAKLNWTHLLGSKSGLNRVIKKQCGVGKCGFFQSHQAILRQED